MGEFKGELGDLTVRVSLDTDKRILTISDSGIRHDGRRSTNISTRSLFGRRRILEKIKPDDYRAFRLGFYSAFMVSNKVEIVTRSYKEGSKTMHWTCDGSPEYTMEEASTERSRGTDVILHLSEGSKEFADKARIREILKKYCSFLPVPIAFRQKTGVERR